MRVSQCALLLCVVAVSQAWSQAPSPENPPPGTRGNTANIPFIGKSDPQGNPVRLARSSGHVSNYDEAKVPPYTLPDPLVLANGQRVTSASQWTHERRPEILKLFETEVYGRVPANAPRVTWEIAENEVDYRDGLGKLRRLKGCQRALRSSHTGRNEMQPF